MSNCENVKIWSYLQPLCAIKKTGVRPPTCSFSLAFYLMFAFVYMFRLIL